MQPFKFLSEDNDNYINPTEEEFHNAVTTGREFYLNGFGLEENPFTILPLRSAFEEGWEMEQSYEILRQSFQRAFNDPI